MHDFNLNKESKDIMKFVFLILLVCLILLSLFLLDRYFLSTEGSPRRRQLFRFVLHSVIMQYLMLTAAVLVLLTMYNKKDL